MLLPDQAGTRRAIALWRAGALVAFPTETVYGLGADASNAAAVGHIFRAKGRPTTNPLIIHVADIATAQRYAHFSDDAQRLADAFWPGPLTLVLPVREGEGLSPLVTAGLHDVAIRIPDSTLARDLLAWFGGAIAAPSANPSGRISPTSAAHVRAGLEGRIEAILDAGPCTVGVESTIVKPEIPALLRPGGLPVAAIEAALGKPLSHGANASKPTSPGQMLSHYAPRLPLRLEVTSPDRSDLWLGFGPACDGAALNLSPSGDLHEAASNLFAHLHRLDTLAAAGTARSIAVAPIPKSGLGQAINDRLARAAAPRDQKPA